MALTDRERHFMERAIALAERGRGLTSPNPLVGALILLNGRVVGEGFHAGPGQDHAEIVAMKDAAGPHYTGRLRGATVFVTLEPCCHHGRTPPCTEALVDAGVSRVVVGAIDPSAPVNSRGLRTLREAGIQIDMADDDLAYKARRQNDPFRKQAITGLPFVTYKYAMTLDGRVATESGDSRWISGEESRRRVHQLRAWSDAVLVGAGTLRADDPELTARDVSARKQPLRVVVDPHLSLQAHAKLVRSARESPVLFVCNNDVSRERVAEVEGWGVEVATLPATEGNPSPREVALLLSARGVQDLLLEGGPRIAAAWWDAGLIDRVVAFVAPVVVAGASSPSPLPAEGYAHMDAALRLRDVELQQSGGDICITGYVREPA